MNRTDYRGPKLPRTLLDQVGGNQKKLRGDVSRKDRRKAERQARKGGTTRKVDRSAAHRQRAAEGEGDEEEDEEEEVEVVRMQPVKDAKPTKSILKSVKPAPVKEPTPETEVDEAVDAGSDDGSEASSNSFTVSRQAAKAGLADEDDEIAALERKLGIKGTKRSKEVGDDELEWMVTGDGSGSEDERKGVKRKRGDDARWLQDKRRKASGAEVEEESEDSDGENGEGIAEHAMDDFGEDEALDNPFSADEQSDDDFAGFDSDNDDEPSPPPKRERENPYIAPVPQPTTAAPAAAGKYIPPSLRTPASAASDAAALQQLQRQLKGQLNRLSDANLPSILQAVEALYATHARQHVTSTLVDLLVTLVSDPSILNDTFLILHAGFAAAIYRVVGTDFGAHLLEKVVAAFDQHGEAEGKQQLNLMAFLANLYALQVTSSALLFDYLRLLLLPPVSEHTTELLLRLIRTCGPQLRAEDPAALKDIVLSLQRHVTETEAGTATETAKHEGAGQGDGKKGVSVRTKYMIDAIRDLRDNRVRTGVAASAVAAESTRTMKRVLGSVGKSRTLRATEPLRVTLEDLRGGGQREGKWWLVGASYKDPAKSRPSSTDSPAGTRGRTDEGDAGYDSETPGHTNLTRAARTQGMNTEVRRQIFITIVGADDYRDAAQRLQGLRLKGKQFVQEVPRVLVHCVGVEEGFNPFYALLARRLCGEEGGPGAGTGAGVEVNAKGKGQGNGVRRVLGRGVWDLLKKLRGEGEDDEGSGDEGGELHLQKMINLAKFYGALIADGTLGIAVLKTGDFELLRTGTKSYVFAEVVLTTVFLQVGKKKKSKGDGDGANFGERVAGLFDGASQASGMVVGLGGFLRQVVARAGLARGKKEARLVKEGCQFALEALSRAAEDGAGSAGSEEEESD
ncbi:suppressor of glycerol defect [Teratosphaeriaceae sp. CCFEE 6253]|nr:suppressor of glycerol defect [Teratosphaeriaceae sp. CCFEE 6253]